MNILTLPLRNLRRKLPRTLLLVLVFSVGIVSVVALGYLSTAVGEALEKKLTAYGANILITPKTETLAVGYGGMRLGDVSYEIKFIDQEEAIRAIRSIDLGERISAVAPKLAVVSRVNETPVGVVGVDWEQELRIKSYWAVDGSLPKAGQADAVLAGSGAAQALGLAPGSTVELEGTVFTVAGVIRSTGSEDDQVLFAPLAALQKATGHEGRAHFIEVSALCSGCPIEDIVAQLERKLPGTEVRAMQQVVRQRMATVSFVKRMALLVGVVILLTACFMIGLSIYAAVNERTREIGLLRAVGFSRLAVFSVFCLEALAVGGVAAVVGYGGGVFAGVELLGLLKLAQGAHIAFNPAHFALTLAGVMALSLAASAFPAYKASRVEPCRALVML